MGVSSSRAEPVPKRAGRKILKLASSSLEPSDSGDFRAVYNERVSAPTHIRPGSKGVLIAGETYDIIQQLGQPGQYGVVYSASKITGDQDQEPKVYAVKHMAPSQKGSDTRVLRSELSVFAAVARAGEAEDNGKVQLYPRLHSYEHFTNGECVLIMDMVTGEELSCDGPKPLSPITKNNFLLLLKAICQPVIALHAVGVAHLDIKPDNIKVQWTDAVPPVPIGATLLDFGLSCSTGESFRNNDTDTCHLKFRSVSAHMDPTYTKGLNSLFQADVFSTGWTFACLTEAYRPSLSKAHGRRVRLLVDRMMDPNPSARPSITVVRRELQRMLVKTGDVLDVQWNPRKFQDDDTTLESPGKRYKVVSRLEGNLENVFLVQEADKTPFYYLALLPTWDQGSLDSAYGYRHTRAYRELQLRRDLLARGGGVVPKLVEWGYSVKRGEIDLLVAAQRGTFSYTRRGLICAKREERDHTLAARHGHDRHESSREGSGRIGSYSMQLPRSSQLRRAVRRQPSQVPHNK